MARPSPLALTEIGPVFDRLLTGPLALAVSGGADSMALMHLVAAWSAGRGPCSGPPPIVLTVDHGLRSESAQEAAAVASAAAQLGFVHATLVWTQPKPVSGLQAAARAARYRLMSDLLAREVGTGALAGKRSIVTAHHADDQAETFLMRLARGSGLDGLSGMREREVMATDAETRLSDASCTILRPLLTIPKARLVATLQAAGFAWCEDPSNASLDFERVRVREALAVLDGLGIGAEQIERSTRRLARARAAVATSLAEAGARLVRLNEGLFGEIEGAAFERLAEELRVRALASLLPAFGGISPPARLSQIEALVAKLSAGPCAATLGGCRVTRSADGPIRIWRETGREALPEVDLQPGIQALWDKRFVVALDARERAAVRVRALGTGGAQAALPTGADWRMAPAGAVESLPSFWRGEKLVAVPYFDAGPETVHGCSARFVAGDLFSDKVGPLLT